MMADEQAIIAQYAEKYGLTDEMIKHAERWTETDGDLAGLSEKRIRGILDLRFSGSRLTPHVPSCGILRTRSM